MKEAKSKVIKGHSYTVSQLPPNAALDMLMDLLKMVGPALTPILGSGKSLLDTEIGEALKSTFLSEAVNALFTNMDKALITKTINQLAEVTQLTLEGGTDSAKLSKVYNAHFMGDLGSLVQWLAFALHTQFADPLGDLGSVLKTLSPGQSKQPQK